MNVFAPKRRLCHFPLFLLAQAQRSQQTKAQLFRDIYPSRSPTTPPLSCSFSRYVRQFSRAFSLWKLNFRHGELQEQQHKTLKGLSCS